MLIFLTLVGETCLCAYEAYKSSDFIDRCFVCQ
uniref:Uncharacterized protein n=1 Tax=Onchocerca volvulus TaxID=6282 RepID=A0A8R1TTL8_ONCVO